jgi:hypothetical protein
MPTVFPDGIITQAGQSLLHDGTALLPSLAFTTTPANGLFAPAAGRVGVAGILQPTTTQVVDKPAIVVDLDVPTSGWTYSIGWALSGDPVDPEWGGFAHLVSSGVRFTALFGPGMSTNGSSGAGSLQFRTGSEIFVTASNGLYATRNKEIGWSDYSPGSSGTTGGSTDLVSAIDWSDAQTNDSIVWGLPDGALSRSIVFCDFGDREFDFAHPVQATPTLFVHSDNAATDEWVSLAHDGTDAIIGLGTGSLLISGGNLSLSAFVSPDDSFASAAADLCQITYTPGTATITGVTTTTSFSHHCFRDTAVVNATATITALSNLHVEYPTATGTITRRAAITAQSSGNWGAFWANAPVANGIGLYEQFWMGSAKEHGGLGAVDVSSTNYGALISPDNTSSTRGIILQSDDYISFTVVEGAFSAQNIDLGVGATIVPGNWASGIPALPRSAFRWNTIPTNDVTMLGLATANPELQIVDFANRAGDYAQGVATHPTIKLFSVTAPGVATDQWGAFTHDGTNFVVSVGTGAVSIQDFTAEDRSTASAASDFNGVTHTPGTETFTGTTTLTSFSHQRFLNTAVANSGGPAAITDLYNVFVEAPTATGTVSGGSSLGVEVPTVFDRAGILFRTDASLGQWVYSAVFGTKTEDAEWGSIAHLTIGGGRCTVIHHPGAATNGSSGAGALQFFSNTGPKVLAPLGIGVAKEQDLYFDANAPVSAGTISAPAPVAGFRFDRTSPTSDVLKLGLATPSATLSPELQIIDFANQTDDYAQPIATNPTVKVFSAVAAATSTAQWGSLKHDGTNFVLDAGTGGVSVKTKMVSIDDTDSPYAATITETILADATAGAITIDLPTAVGKEGYSIEIKKVDATVTAVTIDGAGAETIDGVATQVITTPQNALTLRSDNVNWRIV